MSTDTWREGIIFNWTCPRCSKPIGYIGDLPSPNLLCSCCKQKELTMVGWLCPKCGRGNSPFITTCPCGPDVQITTGNTTNDLPKWAGATK